MAILSFDQLKEHLTALDKLQLITNDGDGMIYLSDKGEAFMKKYERLCKIFDTRKIEN
jgi:predicted transcriptional regulator